MVHSFNFEQLFGSPAIGNILNLSLPAIGLVYFVLGRSVGGDTGFYNLDYGKRATEDLTYRAKRHRLEKEGRFKDPFDVQHCGIPDVTPYDQIPAEVKADFSD